MISSMMSSATSFDVFGAAGVSSVTGKAGDYSSESSSLRASSGMAMPVFFGICTTSFLCCFLLSLLLVVTDRDRYFNLLMSTKVRTGAAVSFRFLPCEGYFTILAKPLLSRLRP